MRTRFAPTPSGYLHIGNLVNADLTGLVAKELGLEVFLRVDDADTARTRPQYVADIFRVVSWLGLPIDVGPQSQSDMSQWSQSQRTDTYRCQLERLEENGAPLFVCSCSRTSLLDGRCIRDCAGNLNAFDPEANSHVVRLRTEFEDVVIWGKFGPAYHLTSVTDDHLFDVTHVIRGDDLKPSTQIHCEIIRWLNIPAPSFAHHNLIVDAQGNKLSKSQGTAQLELSPSLRYQVRELAETALPQTLSQIKHHA